MELVEIKKRFQADQYAVGLTGIEIIDVNEHHVKTTLTVEAKHMNALGIMQGGALFTLADFTFAVAINTAPKEADPKESAVAVECHMSFLKPVTAGVLFAESTIISRSRSLVACDITITNEEGAAVARFHGRGFVRQSKHPSRCVKF